jgi:photosystem II stability/assembly factor-like uncharacterized protein
MTDNIQQITDAVYDLTPSPAFSKDQTIFAARGSGLYRSNDGGKTWKFALDSLNLEAPLAISCVALAPNFPELPHVFAAGPGGVLRSRDAGESWYVTMLPSPPPFITALALSPNYAEDGIVFASTMDDGVFRSRNRGVDWTAWNFGLFDLHVLSIALSPDFAVNKNVFLGTESGIFRSANAGLGWQELDFPIESAPVLSLALADGLIWAGTEESGLFSSADDGQTWQQLADVGTVGSVNTIITSPKIAEMLIMNDAGLLFSRDQGQTWQYRTTDLEFAVSPLAVALPQGVGRDALAIVGLANGEILHLP